MVADIDGVEVLGVLVVSAAEKQCTSVLLVSQSYLALMLGYANLFCSRT